MVNRLATPLPDSVLDRYYAENPSELDPRKQHQASKEAAVEGAQINPEDFEDVFES